MDVVVDDTDNDNELFRSVKEYMAAEKQKKREKKHVTAEQLTKGVMPAVEKDVTLLKSRAMQDVRVTVYCTKITLCPTLYSDTTESFVGEFH